MKDIIYRNCGEKISGGKRVKRSFGSICEVFKNFSKNKYFIKRLQYG